MPADFSAAILAISETLPNIEAHTIKFANTPTATLRPDKFVAYFHSFEALKAAVRVWEPLIDGFVPHCLPFTRSLTENGSLSCGNDPPRRVDHLKWMEHDSWRSWVCASLANAIECAKMVKSSNADLVTFVSQRIKLEGIDFATWSLIDDATEI
jgi:hypothetical protein